MKKQILMILGVITLLLLSSCQQQTRYVCQDGSTVTDISQCPKDRIYCVDTRQCQDIFNNDNVICEDVICKVLCRSNDICKQELKNDIASCIDGKCVILDSCRDNPELCT